MDNPIRHGSGLTSGKHMLTLRFLVNRLESSNIGYTVVWIMPNKTIAIRKIADDNTVKILTLTREERLEEHEITRIEQDTYSKTGNVPWFERYWRGWKT